MKAEYFEMPQRLNMGFHYTQQFSRRTRVCVIGLVDQGSETWTDWYLRMHEPAALREIAAVGCFHPSPDTTTVEIPALHTYAVLRYTPIKRPMNGMIRNALPTGLTAGRGVSSTATDAGPRSAFGSNGEGAGR